MYALNVGALRAAASRKGYRGLSPLLRKLGLHRNTLSRYLAGAPLIPSSVSRVLDELDLPIDRAIVRKLPEKEGLVPDEILSLAEKVSGNASGGCSVFLFGSRARNTAARFSDYDLGVFSQNGLDWKDYLLQVKTKEEFEESSAHRIDLINLNRANPSFLKQIHGDLKLLVGKYSDFLALRKRSHSDEK